MPPPITSITSAIRQSIEAGSQFDGQAPLTSPDLAGQIETFPESTQGGLFVFGHTEVIVIVQVEAKLADATDWTLSKVQEDSTEIPWQVRTAAGDLVIAGEDSYLRLLPGQKLKLVTSGATGAMSAVVYARSESGES